MGKKSRILLALILVLAYALGRFAWSWIYPERPIFIATPGKDTRVERSLCASWYPANSGEWWLVTERGGLLYEELHKASGMQFEIDNGSGLSDVELGREEEYSADPNGVVRTVLRHCSPFLVSRGGPSKLVGIRIQRRH